MAGRAKARRLGNADLAGSIAAAAHGAKSRIEALDAAAVKSVVGAGGITDPIGSGSIIDKLIVTTIVNGMVPTNDPWSSDPNDPTGMGGLEL